MTDRAGDDESEVFEMGGHPFTVRLRHDPDGREGEAWEAVAEELGGCRGSGATREAALEDLRGAIVHHVASDLLDP